MRIEVIEQRMLVFFAVLAMVCVSLMGLPAGDAPKAARAEAAPASSLEFYVDLLGLAPVNTESKIEIVVEAAPVEPSYEANESVSRGPASAE